MDIAQFSNLSPIFKQGVIKALLASTSQDKTVKDQSQAQLKEAQHTQGFCPFLLYLSSDKKFSSEMNLQAVKSLNYAFQKVDKEILMEESKEGYSDQAKEHQLTMNDLVLLRTHFLECISQARNDEIMESYQLIIASFIYNFYKDDWEDFNQQVLKYLSSHNDKQIYSALLALKAIGQSFSFKTKSEVLEQKEKVVTMYFDTLVNTVYAKYSKQESDWALKIVYMVVAVLLKFNSVKLLKMYSGVEEIRPWVTLIKEVLERDVPQHLSKKTTDQEEIKLRNKHPFWNLKSIAAKAFDSIFKDLRDFDKFDDSFEEEEEEEHDEKSYSKDIIKEYELGILQSLFNQFLKVKESFVGHKFIHYCLLFMKRTVQAKSENTKWLLQQVVENHVIDILLQLIKYTDYDISLFNSDPDKFLQLQTDMNEQKYNLRVDISNFLGRLCIKNPIKSIAKVTEEKFLIYLNDTLSSKQLQTDWKLKEAVLYLIGTIQMNGRINKEGKKVLEETLIKYAVPEFQSENPFLKMRVCWIYSNICRLQFTKSHLDQILENVLQCINDEELLVKFYALLALEQLSSTKNSKTVINESINNVINVFLQLFKVLDNEQLFTAFASVVYKYKSIIPSYAEELLDFMITFFQKMLPKIKEQEKQEEKDYSGKDYQEPDQDYFEKTYSCLEIIESILQSVKSKADLIESYSKLLLPIFSQTIQEDGFSEFLIEVCKISTILICNSSGQTLEYYQLEYLQNINNFIQKDEGNEEHNETILDISMDLSKLLKAYIMKDPISLATIQCSNSQETYFEALLKSIKNMDNYLTQDDEENISEVLQLLVSVLGAFKGKYDPALEPIMTICLDHLFKEYSSHIKQNVLAVITLCFWFNGQQAFAILDSKQQLQQVLIQIQSTLPSVKKKHNMKLFILGLVGILSTNQAYLPTFLKDNLGQIVMQLVPICNKVREKRDKEYLKKKEAKVDSSFEDAQKTLYQLSINRNKGF